MAQRTVATPALSFSSLSAVGEVFFKNCSASLHLQCSASERLCFTAVAGSTTDALPAALGDFCVDCALAPGLAIYLKRRYVVSFRNRFVNIKLRTVVLRLTE